MRSVKNILALLIMMAGTAMFAAKMPETAKQDNDRLIQATREGNLVAMKQLLGRGADPKVKDAEGTPVLMLAALYAPSQAVQMLLDAGADPNARNQGGATALHIAAGDSSKARALVAKGADVNVRSAAGRTPLMIAAAHDGNSSVVKLLLDKGADINARDGLKGMIFTGGGGDSALIEAAKTSDARMVQLLLDRNAEVNAVNSAGGTALHEASLRGTDAIVKLLVSRGADVNAQVKMGNFTPLIMASMSGSAPTIETLLRAGARVNDADMSGSTPLMWAAQRDRPASAAVAALLAAGAKVDTKNKMNETALTWARRRGTTSITAMLEQAGAASDPVDLGPIQPKQAGTPTPQEAITRSLAAFDKSGPVFFKTFGCVSCHQQSLPLEAAALARRAGVPINEQAQQQQMKYILGVVKPAREILLENTDILPDLQVTGPYILLGMASQNYAADGLTDALVHNLASKQQADGRWIGWAHRAPLESGDIQATAYNIRVLDLYGMSGRRREFQSRIARARDWLRSATAFTTEEKVMKLAGLAWSHAPEADIRSAAASVLADQRPDGGWGQLATLPTDAYATGKAMVMLHQGAHLGVSSDAYRKGVQYLLASQYDDGSWHVRTRSFPFQPLKPTGYPHGRDEWISAAGASWATMALAYSLEPAEQVAKR